MTASNPAVVRPTRHRTALQIAVILVALSFQANVLLLGQPVLYIAYYLALFICFVKLLPRRFRWAPLIIFSAFVAVSGMVGQPFKGLGLAVGAYLGYIAVHDYEQDYTRVVVWIFALNLVVTVAQFLGVAEVFHSYQLYSSESLRANLLAGEPDGFWLPQMRPSGIFPNATYISAFAVFMYTILAAPQIQNRSLLMFLGGVFYAIIGNTLGLFLMLASMFLAFGRRGHLYLLGGYSVAMIIYARLLPLRFLANFNPFDIVVSFSSRLDLSAVRGESVVQQNILLFLLLCGVGAAGLFFVRRMEALFMMVPFVIVMILPVLVHNIALSMFYWFLVGSAFARLALAGLAQHTHTSARVGRLDSPRLSEA